jgi:hypothetical protein
MTDLNEKLLESYGSKKGIKAAFGITYPTLKKIMDDNSLMWPFKEVICEKLGIDHVELSLLVYGPLIETFLEPIEA